MMQKCLQLCIYSLIVIFCNESACSQGISVTRSKSDMIIPAGATIKTATGEIIRAQSPIRVVTDTETVNIGQNGQFTPSQRTAPAAEQSGTSVVLAGVLAGGREPEQKKSSTFAKIKKLVREHPRATGAAGATIAGLTLLHTYRTDKKFRSRVHETSDHYYYKMLEKLMPISFKWSDLENQALTQRDVLLVLGAIGAARLGSVANTQYQLYAKLGSLCTQLKQVGSNGYAKISDRLGGENTLLFYGVSGILLAASCRYLYSLFSRQPIYYKEFLNRFMHSLDQEQINSIGLETLFQADSDPSVLEQDAVQKFLNSKQKSRVVRIMLEYHKYLEKLARA